MLTVRKAELEDYRTLSAFSVQTFEDTFLGHPKNKDEDVKAYTADFLNENKIKEELLDKNCLFFLAEMGEALVGYAKVNFGVYEECIVANNPTELQRIYVDTKCKGQGIGKLLLKKCVSAAIDNKSDVIWLGVWEDNLAALDFYTHNGFRRVGEHTFLLGSDPQTDYILRNDLQ